ncbi:tripartite tricarboxylate transporter substrate binding protein [Pseudorhodoplanes sp.]|uniref:Bug family tripartite tricarboxylate transporter substrate binding protein n=1 Tax=Pseudorhodoplanes sp. TaxID=1934341 RepID=UPI002BFCAF34|nr:tripartite tricarboxylate transporter substrate binding protein [Pseudorhodoplanes sp.]HWV51559.1 tripartite tricarboxylate transporter substrate binding protein [Pseudorhodoplanes sp.]
MTLKRVAITLCSTTLIALGSFATHAQDYPAKPITIIVPWPPAGSVDISARALGKEITAALGQGVVIDNRSGAAGSIGSALGARAPHDGYTLTFGNATTHATNAVTMPGLSYNPFTDFTPITLVHKSTMVVAVSKSSPVSTLKELIEYAKARPGLTYGTPGLGTPQHLIGQLLNQKAGLQLSHVPYRGGGPVVNDLMGGHITIAVGVLSQYLTLQERGDLKIIAIADEARNPAIPNVPTISETLEGVVVSGWGALYAPKGTSPEIVKRIGDVARKALASPDFRKVLEAAGLTPAASSPEELLKIMESDIALWKALPDKGIKLSE